MIKYNSTMYMNLVYQINMMKTIEMWCSEHKLKYYLLVSLHWLGAIILFIYSILAVQNNQLGQNLINFVAVSALIVRLDNIIILYRIYINQSFIENYATMVILFLVFFGLLIQKFHPTSDLINPILNQFCRYFLYCLMGINLFYYAAIVLAIFLYIIRQLYKLLAGTLLSSSATLMEQELRAIKNSGKVFAELLEDNVQINMQCSICLLEFEPDEICILLPGCKHNFHQSCIAEWLEKGKATCPFCRNNIRLGMMRNL